MFSELNLPISIPAMPLSRQLVQHSGSHDRAKFLHTDKLDETKIAGIKLYLCGEKFDTEILSQLPKELLDVEVPYVYAMDVEKESTEANYLPPHIDRGRRCALNFYTECGEEVTEFYDANTNLLGSFSAKKGSAWLLDVSKPHAVRFNSSAKRSGVTLSFRHKNYDKIADVLKGYIKC